MKYDVLRTDTADANIREAVLYVAESFGQSAAMKKLDELEQSIMLLADNPEMGVDPKDRILRRQGYKVLVLERNLVFYKIDHDKHRVIIYAVVDQRRDYVNIIKGL